MSFLSNPVFIAVVSAVVLLVLVIGAVASRYRIAKSDEAYIITGGKNKKVVIGGGVFVIPFVQQANKLSLMTRRIPLQISGVLSSNNVLLNIDGVAMVKVGGTQNAVLAASERFLGQQNEIENFATETLNGSLRAIIGGLTVEQIIRDRAALASAVREEAESSLANQGLVIDTLTIQSVTDNNNYIHNLSRPETARAEQEAKIAEAAARQNAAQKEVEAEQNIAIAQKELALRQAAIQSERDRAQAEANAAGPIAKAAQDQSVLAAAEQVAERQALLTARELESEVNKPAEAEKYRVMQEAEANKAKAIAEAEARARAVQLEAEAELAQRRARAQAVQLEGEAEAAAIRAKGEAEAEALSKKAEAYKQYSDAAVTQMFVEMLPKVAGEIARPLNNIKDMTIISNDGASKLTQTTTDILTQTLGVAKELTGYDFTNILSKNHPVKELPEQSFQDPLI